MVITKGSIESIIVRVRDQVHEVDALPGTTRFDILDADEAPVLVDQVPTLDGLEAICVIDSTNVLLPEGDYDLYLHFPVGVETPRLGPHKFSIR